MFRKKELIECVICRSAIEPIDSESLLTRLAKQDESVSSFVAHYEIISNETNQFDDDECVCRKCFTLVEYCDHLCGVFFDVIDQLKTRRLTAIDRSHNFIDCQEQQTPIKEVEQEQVKRLTGELLKCRHCQFKTRHKASMQLHRNKCHLLSPMELEPNVRQKLIESIDMITPRVNIERLPSNNPPRRSMTKRPRNGEGKLFCDICLAAFNKSSGLATHHSRVHGIKLKNVCNVCGKDFAAPQTLKRHLEMHEPTDKYECNKCFKPFRSYTTFRMHVQHGCGNKVRYPSAINRIVCDLCGKQVVSGLMRQHKKHKCPHGERLPTNQLSNCNSSNSTNNNIKRLCEFCGKDFALFSYYQHIIIRNGERTCRAAAKKESVQIPCHLCSKVFKNTAKLNDHLRNHHNVVATYDERKFDCPHCDQKLSSKYTRVAHVYKAHGILTPGFKHFTCTHCGKIFHTVSKLDYHVLAMHTKDPECKYQCNICGYSTIYPSYVAIHKRTHSVE